MTLRGSVRAMVPFALLGAFWLVSCSSDPEPVAESTPPAPDAVNFPAATRTDKVAPSVDPPAGLTARQVPMFVVLGSDDNGYAGLESEPGSGITFLLELFKGRKNPAGKGNAATFDGAPAHLAFYVETAFLSGSNDLPTPSDAGGDPPAEVKKALRAAFDAGHEIGCHTHSHSEQLLGNDAPPATDTVRWAWEYNTCMSWLTKPYDAAKLDAAETGLGLPVNQLVGWRTPFLAYNDNLLKVLDQSPVVYDCSVEEGAVEEPGKFPWPYTLDAGSPGNAAAASESGTTVDKLTSHPGMWEIPVYDYVVPPDDLCEKYGVPKGFRDRMKKTQSWFDTSNGYITGFDWNLWFAFGMTKAEFVATMEYSFDLALNGNRAPFTLGMHSDIYTERYSTDNVGGDDIVNSTGKDRQEALKAVVEYMAAKADTRFVTGVELLQWLRKPTAL